MQITTLQQNGQRIVDENLTRHEAALELQDQTALARRDLEAQLAHRFRLYKALWAVAALFPDRQTAGKSLVFPVGTLAIGGGFERQFFIRTGNKYDPAQRGSAPQPAFDLAPLSVRVVGLMRVEEGDEEAGYVEAAKLNNYRVEDSDGGLTVIKAQIVEDETYYLDKVIPRPIEEGKAITPIPINEPESYDIYAAQALDDAAVSEASQLQDTLETVKKGLGSRLQVYETVVGRLEQ